MSGVSRSGAYLGKLMLVRWTVKEIRSMKYCNEDVAKWVLPCGYPRQWLDEGGCLVVDDAPAGVPCVIGPDGKPVRDENGLLVQPTGYIIAWEPLCGNGTVTAYASRIFESKEKGLALCKELNKKFLDTDLYQYHLVKVCYVDGRLVALADDGQVLVVL